MKCQGGQRACGSTFGVLGMADPGVIGAGEGSPGVVGAGTRLSENGTAGRLTKNSSGVPGTERQT